MTKTIETRGRIISLKERPEERVERAQLRRSSRDRRIVRAAVLFSALAITGLVACESEPAPTIMVTDSAGIRITLTPDAPTTYAVVDPQPSLSLGGPDATGPTQFYRVQHVHVDRSGRLWVADGQSNELRIFNPDGSHWKTVGGQGEGPGEFLRIRLLGSFRGDSLAVWDQGTARLTVFDGEGELVRSGRVARESTVPVVSSVFGDGTVLGQLGQVIQSGSIEAGQILGDSVRLARFNPDDSSQRRQGSAQGPLWVWTGRYQVALPFTINATFKLVDESVHLVSGPSFRIRIFENGGLSEIYGVEREAREVTDSGIAAYREIVEEYYPEEQQGDYLAVLDHPMRPGVLPAYSNLIVANEGHVWAQIYGADLLGPSIWDVYDGARRWLGQVRTPEGFTIMSITENSVVGVWRDDVGVEHVRVYRIRPT